ncbi:MAG TPA: rhodanese-like domain-containing protein [Stenomitos sp.]
MRNRPLLIAGLVLTLGLLGTQAPKLWAAHTRAVAAEAAAQKAADLRHASTPGFLTPKEVYDFMQAGVKVRIGDVRKVSNYERKHIQGALSLPHADFKTWGPKLSRDELVVLYCT